MPEQYQSVVITLDDGTRLVYTGKAQVFEGDTRTPVSWGFTEPKDLPAGTTFDVIKEDANA